MLIWMLVHCSGAQRQNYKNGVLAQQVMDLTVFKLSLNWTNTTQILALASEAAAIKGCHGDGDRRVTS